MKSHSQKCVVIPALLTAAALSIILLGSAAATVSTSNQPEYAVEPSLAATQPLPPCVTVGYIEIVVDKTEVEVGDTFTATILYHELTEPSVYRVYLNPNSLAEFNPPMESWPCNLCSVFQLRAIAPGRLTVYAAVDGYMVCTNNGDVVWKRTWTITPTDVMIHPGPWRQYLPLVGR